MQYVCVAAAVVRRRRRRRRHKPRTCPARTRMKFIQVYLHFARAYNVFVHAAGEILEHKTNACFHIFYKVWCASGTNLCFVTLRIYSLFSHAHARADLI